MKLQELLKDVALCHAQKDIQITGLTLDTRQIQPGELFIAQKGASQDGRAFLEEAKAKGASAVVCEAQGLSDFQVGDLGAIPVIPIRNLTEKLELLIKRYYGEPSQEIKVTGVTGTNGKTTSTYLLAQALSRLGEPCGIIGTLGYGVVNHPNPLHWLKNPSALTTPDAVSLQKYLKDLKTQGAQSVAMEVSSHGLAQHRVKNIHFESAMFTNLTQDHLDYHANMEAYGRVKQKLFQFSSLKRAVLNADNDYADKILSATRRDLPVMMYSLRRRNRVYANRSSVEFIHVDSLELDQKGIKATIDTPWGKGVLRSSLLGEFNVSNLLGVLGELCLRGIPLEEALKALALAVGAPGRMQRLGGVREPHIIVDYAHTPDALENALKAARLHCRRRLWCVFGCGGDRDKEKRAKMGNIATRLADRVVITNDNPRSEDPQSIIENILQGVEMAYSDKIVVEEDRHQAIEYAIQHALPIDTVLIAGKGHENYQMVGDQKLPFNDVECVKMFLSEDGKG